VPRSVDHDERRREVARAAIRLLAKKGLRGLTLRALAEELGGSITMVTHFFQNRSAILDAVTQVMIEDSAAELAEFDSEGLTAQERLRAFLGWLLPTTEESLALERSRVMVAAESNAFFDVQNFYDTWERTIRDLIASYVAPIVAPEQQDFYVDLVRVMQNGVVLSAVEHPTYWTGAKQQAFVDGLMSLIAQAQDAQPGHRVWHPLVVPAADPDRPAGGTVQPGDHAHRG
jgi:AcrR family transcriptional regulator